jgi:hypothetical protein
MRDRHFPVALFPFVIEKAYFTRYSCPMTWPSIKADVIYHLIRLQSFPLG